MSSNNQKASLKCEKPKIKPSGSSKVASVKTPLRKNERSPHRFVFQHKKVPLPKVLVPKDTINETRPAVFKSPNTFTTYKKGNIYAIIFWFIQF